MDYILIILPVFLITSLLFFNFLQQKRVLKKSSNTFRLENRTKYPEVNVFKNRPIFLKVGLVLSLSFVLMAFSYTTFEQEPDSSFIVSIDADDIEVIPPRTPPVQKKLPPPPLEIIEVPNEIPIDEPELIPLEVDAETEIELILPEPKKESVKEIPLPPPPEEDLPDKIMNFAEEMPRFPGCNQGSKEEKKKCSDQKLLSYLAKNLRYPTVARENGIEGRLYVRFVVNQDGSIEDAEVLRDIGGGCGDAALKVVESMNDLPQRWSPGKQGGKNVRVKYTLPVTFTLDK